MNMKLRIISGKLKGRYINIPEFGTEFRPTLERTRQSVAEIIKSILPDALVADICAGSGAFGFEMLSRGARRADLIECDRRRADLIKKNAQSLGVSDQVRCICQDVRTFIKNTNELYEVIFYDPPYDDKNLLLLIPDLLNVISENGILIHERRAEKKSSFSVDSRSVEPFDIRTFGDTVVELYHSSKNSK